VTAPSGALTARGVAEARAWSGIDRVALDLDGLAWGDSSPAPRARQRDLPDLAARVGIGSLFLFLAVRILRNFMETGRLTGLLLLASELLVVILTIARRPALDVDRRWSARIVAAISMAGPPLVRPIAGTAGQEDLITAALSAVGLLIVIGAKISLGRSFGLMPANRGIVSSGLYRFVRHPIYAGYLITHVGFLIANPTWWNLATLGIADTVLIVRSLFEERTLVQDAAYKAYCGRVRWRICPGIY
jgi:hypothetical protein